MAKSSNSKTGIPSYLEDPVKKSLKKIESWAGSADVWGEKGQDLYAPLADQQTDAIGNVEWLADQDLGQMFGGDEAKSMFGDAYNTYGSAGDIYGQAYNTIGSSGSYYNDANSMFQDIGNTGPTTVDNMGRLVDENGYLGSIDSYMNPYIQNTLDPVIRELNQSYDRNSNQIGSMAAMSGAYGDARHGVMEGLNMENLYQQIGDSTAGAYSQAFNNAMGLRNQDVNREMQRQQFNQSAIEQALNRSMLAGQNIANVGELYSQMGRDQAGIGSNIAGLGQQFQGLGRDQAQLGQMQLDQWTDVNDMLFNSGQTLQDQAQRELDSEKAIFEAIENKKYNNYLALLCCSGQR